MTKRPRVTKDALEILDHLYFRTPRSRRALALATLNAEIAQQVYALRTKAGLSQKKLAKMIGTTESVISQMEDADYEGNSLKVLQRISSALNLRLEIHFVPLKTRRKSA